jgi:hypothetical protein
MWAHERNWSKAQLKNVINVLDSLDLRKSTVHSERLVFNVVDMRLQAVYHSFSKMNDFSKKQYLRGE